MKGKKIFRESLNFKKEEMQRAQLGIEYSGVSMAIPENYEVFKEEFTSTKDWLDFSSGGFNKDVKAKDLMPKKEDFVEAPFRLLSATTVGAGSWKATDFSDVAVLKGSVSKLEGKPLYKDHYTNLDNWVGLVKGVKWSAGFVGKDGIKVPAGIDGIVAIDAKTNPKVARGVLMGSIFSNSVTVEFDWVMSHHFEDAYEFRRKIGTYAEDGKMIRRVVTQIFNYHESSLVWLGADPFAKAIQKDGQLQNIDVANIEYSKAKVEFEKEEEEIKNKYESDNTYSVKYGFDAGVLSLNKRTVVQVSKNKTEEMKELMAAFILKFGLDATELTEKQMIDYLKGAEFLEDAIKLKAETAETVEAAALSFTKETDATVETVDLKEFMKTHKFISATKLVELQKAKNDVTALTKEKEDLGKKVTSLSAKAKLGNDYLEMKRKEAIRLYKLAVGNGKAEESVINLFKEANSDAVEGLLKQYTKSATHKFSGKCQDCGSTEFEFKSSLASDEGAQDDEDAFELSATDMHKKYDKPTWNIGTKSE